ncbi:hypothetical protein C6Q14_28305 [Burkholderia ambifaria]|jgi:hypothetical protein|uniref:hypothetical protein n=1 Tax=Burkholderia ambifaria TaxID=152480 RepID=UPI000D004EE0|nr:hypothetical protein [Burkholderia ambifaria]PRF97446.1 hypothetical protein C6Q14_28305 [Burkholderia ambifaria]
MSRYDEYAEAVRARREKQSMDKIALQNAAAKLVEAVNAYAGISPQLPHALALARADDQHGTRVNPGDLSDFGENGSLKFRLIFQVMWHASPLGKVVIPAVVKRTDESVKFYVQVNNSGDIDFYPHAAEAMDTAAQVWDRLTAEFDKVK